MFNGLIGRKALRQIFFLLFIFFNEQNNHHGTDHAVALVGWDDSNNAWLLKNSWDVDWGEQGYMWIAYDSNGVGQYAAWVEAPVGYDWGLL